MKEKKELMCKNIIDAISVYLGDKLEPSGEITVDIKIKGLKDYQLCFSYPPMDIVLDDFLKNTVIRSNSGK